MQIKLRILNNKSQKLFMLFAQIYRWKLWLDTKNIGGNHVIKTFSHEWENVINTINFIACSSYLSEMFNFVYVNIWALNISEDLLAYRVQL